MEQENRALLGQVLQQSTTPYGENEHPRYTDTHSAGSYTSPGGTTGNTPWGTEDTLKEAVAKTAEMEGKLMELNLERQDLDGELQRLPTGAPKNVRDRKRKAAIEERMVVVDKEIGSLKLLLRNPHLQ